jgi:hypothetical protein
MVGSLFGFLLFNANPAQVFMGDTGSQAIGAALAIVALMSEQWLLLPIIASIFVFETLSVIIQRLGFRYGKMIHGDKEKGPRGYHGASARSAQCRQGQSLGVLMAQNFCNDPEFFEVYQNLSAMKPPSEHTRRCPIAELIALN